MQDLLQQATQLKQAQVDRERPLWNAWPAFFQNTLFHPSSAARAAQAAESAASSDTQARTLWTDARFKHHPGASSACAGELVTDALQRALEVSKGLKAQGNRFFSMGDVTSAGFRYEEAAGLFDFVEPAPDHPAGDWEKNGIKDANVSARWFSHDWRRWCSGRDDAVPAGLVREVAQHLATVLCNIAVCTAKQERWDESRRAAQHVLEHLDAGNLKAAHRAAVALTTPATASSAERDSAITLLRIALEANQDANGAAADNNDDAKRAEVRALLVSLEAERRSQAERGRKMFGGVFEKSEWRSAADAEAEQRGGAVNCKAVLLTASSGAVDDAVRGDYADNTASADIPKFPAQHAQAPIFRDTTQAWSVVEKMLREARELEGRGGEESDRSAELFRKAKTMTSDLVAVCAKKIFAESLTPAMATSPVVLTTFALPGDPLCILESAPLSYGRNSLRLLGFDTLRWNRVCKHFGRPDAFGGADLAASKEFALFTALDAKCREEFVSGRVERMRPADAATVLVAENALTFEDAEPFWGAKDRPAPTDAQISTLRLKLARLRQSMWGATKTQNAKA